MAVLKPSVSNEHLQDAIVLDLGDLRARADALCNEARERADTLIREAEEERERLLSTAHEEGFEAGHRAGFDEGLAQGQREGHAQALQESSGALDALRQAFERALSGFESERADVMVDARRDVLLLAAELARRVALRSVELDESVVERQVERVLRLAIEPTRVVLRVHPDDAQRTEEALPGVLDRFVRSPDALVETDAALERGSCVLRTDRGEIDASVGVMLDEITSALLPGSDGESS